jgi:hypothetical protein
MILRTQQDYDEAQRLKKPVYCSGCREPTGYQYLEQREGAWCTWDCCGEPVYVKDDEKLVELHGPAWGAFVGTPWALLSARWTLPDGRPAPASMKVLAIVLIGWLDRQVRGVIPDVFPEEETLAEQAGVSESTIRRDLQAFERLGLIVRTRRHRASGARASSYIDARPLRDEINRLAADRAGEGEQNLGAKLTPRHPDRAANLAGREAKGARTRSLGAKLTTT